MKYSDNKESSISDELTKKLKIILRRWVLQNISHTSKKLFKNNKNEIISKLIAYQKEKYEIYYSMIIMSHY